ncbi:Elongation factor Ts, mitochondrial [Linderina macrospora]|uniref:Elongation factor Ts, mitochondrial n=1 Tax=Linderina macrospora TaxID=4868 RepID=A0ACC1J9F6_9FUNG|nr:Elongation factor Ts, mitochondrial [Linderina macrospora]
MSFIGLSMRRSVLAPRLRPTTTLVRAYTTAKVDIKALKKLRTLNPVAMTKAKEALLNCDNDITKALAWLEEDALKSGAKKADKVKDRVAAEGAISVFVNESLTAAAIVELGCETDFVARNTSFVDLAAEIAHASMGFASASAESAVLANIETRGLATMMLEGRSVSDTITETIGRLGENIVLRRAAVVGAPSGTDKIVVSGYVHGSVKGSDSASAGKIGGLVAVTSDIKSDAHRSTLSQLTRRLAQQVVGYAPRFATMEEYKKAGEMTEAPDAVVLEEQQFLFGGGSVKEVLAKISKELGAPVEILSFVRYERGEGVEKADKPDFAEEVRQQLA